MKSLLDSKTKTVAGNIRKVRIFKNYTQDYLAMKLNISQNAYSKLELGYGNITVIRLMEIADVLEVDMQILMCLDGFQLVGAAGGSRF
ncbi:helix-turn-helix domain-containing protein [Pedobacter sp. PWIIR3]